MELFPEDKHLHRWLKMARERVEFQGLPVTDLLAGIRRTRPKAGHRFNLTGGSRRGEGADRDRERPPRLRFGGKSRTGRRRE